MLEMMQELAYEERKTRDSHPVDLLITDMPLQKMAVVHTVGSPERVMHLILPALYSAVYRLNHDLREVGRDFRVGHLRVRWPDAHLMPRDRWHGIWGLPIPEDTLSLPQRFPYVGVEIETWKYGTVAQIVHHGPSGEEETDIARLKLFIAEMGYEVDGPLEEEYLAGPDPEHQKTIVRYPVRLQRHPTALGPALKQSLVLVVISRD